VVVLYQVDRLTLGVVFLQDLKASPAAVIASLVWARVISGTVPSSAPLAGSTPDGKRRSAKRARQREEQRGTYHGDLSAFLSLYPLPIDKTLGPDQRWILQPELVCKKEG